jgi:Xaa-Pro aminopeptidase
LADRFATRRDKLRHALKKPGVDSLLVTDFTNVTYLTGFTGDDSYLLAHPWGEVVVSDARYSTQLEEECPGLDLHIRRPGVSMVKALTKVLKASGIGRLGVEADSMTLSLRDEIAAAVPKLELVSTTGIVEQFREIKDRDEVRAIRQAVGYAQQALEIVRTGLRPEKTEKQVATELETAMRNLGAKGSSFPSIVAVGPRAALPHARPTDRQIGSSDLVLIDWGADGGLYKSDLTRVLVTARISPKLQRVYGVVLKAQLRAIAAIRPRAEAWAIDRRAREVIHQAGFGRYFGHGLGHGLGLQVHEAPRLAANSKVVLKPGMVVTVEPGIYLPGWGGVRIEDDVLVTPAGHEVLTNVGKRLEDVVL